MEENGCDMMAENDCEVGHLPMSDLTRFVRFLTVSGASSASSLDSQCDEATLILRLIASGDGETVVAQIERLSAAGRVPSEHLSAFALAVCTKLSSEVKTRRRAHRAVAAVCRSAAHLLHYVDCSRRLAGVTGGWSHAQRLAVAAWYNRQTAAELATAVTTVCCRLGWSHANVLSLCHVTPKDDATSLVLHYVMKGLESAKTSCGDVAKLSPLIDYLAAVELLKKCRNKTEAAALIVKFGFTLEQVPTWLQNKTEVWRPLLQEMPLAEILSNLCKLALLDLLNASSKDGMATLLVEKLGNNKLIHPIQPLTVLAARKRYAKGDPKSKVKKNKWSPNAVLLAALDKAYYTTLLNIESSKQRHLVAVNASLRKSCFGVKGLTTVDAAAVAVMTIVRTEDDVSVVKMSSSVTEVKITPASRLDAVCRAVAQKTTEPVDCSQLISWAEDNKKMVDVFVVLSESDSFDKSSSVGERLRKYRKTMQIPHAKLAACSLVHRPCSVADHDDTDMLDITEYDASTPALLRSFARGQLSADS